MPASLAVRLIAAAALMGAAAPVAASAATGDDCPTWLPDFRCERSGRWEGFHPPMVAFPLFEDPFITTGLQAYHMWHDFPKQSVMGGGHAHGVAVQARVALTDRLALIATKDGYVWNRPNSPLLNDTQGFLNIAGGLKYALFVDEERRIIVSPVLRFELPIGSTDTLQGYGDGAVLPSVSAAWGPGSWRFQGSFGSQIPLNGAEQSASLFYHLNAAYDTGGRFQPFVQVSGLTWVHSGDGKLPVKLKSGIVTGNEVTLDAAQDVTGSGRAEGADVFNLGSRGVAGQDLVTWAVGGTFALTKHVTLGFGYERPLTDRKGIFQQRVTSTLVLEY